LSARRFNRFCAQIGLELEPYQKKISTAAFSPERELAVIIGRGNAKTTLGAALAVHHLLTVERPAVVVGAGSREQARVCFEAARDLCEHPSIADRVTVRHLELRVPGGHLRVVASDGSLAHGPTPTLSILDELWAHKNGDLYEACRTALVKRPDARLLVLSTAPRSLDTPLGRVRSRALSGIVRRRGVLTEARAPGLRLLEWSLDPQADDLDDERKVAACNPASWITQEMLAEQREALPRPVFLQFHACVTGAGEWAWLPVGAWDACQGETSFEPGERVYIGADLGGGERSTSAVVYLNERLHVGCEVFDGESSAVDAAEFIAELAATFTVVEAVYDPWQGALLAETMEQRGLTAVSYPQSDARLCPASERLYRAVVEGRIVHDGHPQLAAHVRTAVAKQKRSGWRLHRAGRDPIDAVIALAMALDRAEHVQQPVQLLGWL
jgi:phage terminase large subunit-like protein